MKKHLALSSAKEALDNIETLLDGDDIEETTHIIRLVRNEFILDINNKYKGRWRKILNKWYIKKKKSDFYWNKDFIDSMTQPEVN